MGSLAQEAFISLHKWLTTFKSLSKAYTCKRETTNDMVSKWNSAYCDFTAPYQMSQTTGKVTRVSILTLYFI